MQPRTEAWRKRSQRGHRKSLGTKFTLASLGFRGIGKCSPTLPPGQEGLCRADPPPSLCLLLAVWRRGRDPISPLCDISPDRKVGWLTHPTTLKVGSGRGEKGSLRVPVNNGGEKIPPDRAQSPPVLLPACPLSSKGPGSGVQSIDRDFCLY